MLPMDLFRGFVPLGKGKKPLIKYKNEKLKSYDDVKNGNFDGVLNKGYIMVDVDEQKDAEKLIKIILNTHSFITIQIWHQQLRTVI